MPLIPFERLDWYYSRFKDQGSASKFGQCDINARRLIYGHLVPANDALATAIAYAYARYWDEVV